MSGLDGFGTTLSRGDGAASEVFTAIGNLTSVSIPGFSREIYDVTAHDSPDKHREWIGGIIDGGEVSVNFNYDPAVEVGGATLYETMLTDAQDPDPVNYEIALPDGSVFACALLISSFEDIDVPFDGPATGSMTFKMSGSATFTASS